jgi:hypothetical protein
LRLPPLPSQTKPRRSNLEFAHRSAGALEARTIRFLTVLLCPIFAVGLANAQNADILATAPPTSIVLETDYTGNDDLPNCDWYTPAAEFLTSEEPEKFGRACRVNIRIRGIINRDGAKLFAELISSLKDFGYQPTSIVLNSRGGDADAAISMARIIRDTAVFDSMQVETRIDESYDAVCFSACVVIFSAGYQRSLDFNINGDNNLPSRLGMHGPGQFDRNQASYDTSLGNSEIMRMSRRLKEYFRDIGVAEEFVDDMFNVPFDEIHLLTRQELISYGLYSD